MKTISERIKEALHIRGMRQSELVEKTGIGKSSISTYISGAYEPKQKNIYKIAKALNVTEPWLMGLDVPMDKIIHPNTPDTTICITTTKLIKVFNKLNETGKKEAINRIEELTEINKYVASETPITNIVAETTEKYLVAHAAHDKKGTFTEDDYKHDDDIMNDDGLWNS